MDGSSQEVRFLVTQKCTNGCFFCHGEGLQAEKADRMSAEDIGYVFNTARLHFGCVSTTLTGGEPLLRPDILDIASNLYHNSAKVTLTTNGVLLEDKMHIGNYLERLNISIHSVRPDMYGVITQRPDVFHKVISGLKQFRRRFPDVEIRLNATLLQGYNSTEEDLDGLLEFAGRYRASVKFVELYPSTAEGYMPAGEATGFLLKRGYKSIISTTRKKDYSNGFVEVGVTKIFCASARDHRDPAAYCAASNDLFVSPDGKIKPCRHNPEEIDILHEVREKDSVGLCKKLTRAFSLLGQGCLIGAQKELPTCVKCTMI